MSASWAIVALEATDAAPIAKVVQTVTVDTGFRAVFGDLGAVLDSLAPARGMASRSVMTQEARNLAGPACKVGAMTAGALFAAVGPHFSAVLIAGNPTFGMVAGGSVMALVTAHGTPTAEVIFAMA